jgi:hypothetical protein
VRAEAVGFGWVVLRRGPTPHRVAVEAATHPMDQPLGPHMASWLDRVGWLRDRDHGALLDERLVCAPALRRDLAQVPSVDGWQTAGEALRLDEGFRWTLPCDDATAAIVGGCDGATPLRSLVTVLAAALGEPETEVAAAVCATVRGLVDRGVLLPGTPGTSGGAA